MGEIIRNIDAKKLLEGKVFSKDELIISNSRNRMETIRKEPESEEIRCFVYRIIPTEKRVNYSGGCGVVPGDPDYEMYKKKLAEVGLWH